MGKRANPTLVGAFVLGALAIVIAVVIGLGSSHLFTRQHKFVMFFSSDVNGLLWIDVATNRLVKAQLDVPGEQGSSGGPVTVTFTDFDAPVTVTAPA